MPVQDDICTLLKASVATAAGNRVSFDRQREMQTMPFLLLSETGGEASVTHSGPDSFRNLTFQVRAVASTGLTVRALIEAVRTKLHGYEGGLSGINYIVAQNEPSATSEEAAGVFQATQDFKVYYYA